MNNRNVYGIMIKYPEPGRVKTRLARDVGDLWASDISRQVAETVLRNTLPLKGEYDRVIFIDPQEKEAEFMSWLPGQEFICQDGGDLGERMYHAIGHLLGRGAAKAVITGGDIPKLGRGIILQAFRGLEQAEVVIGPASDGGYYLIGMKSPITELFRGISWGTQAVFSETVRALERLAISYYVLPVLSDLDTVDDLADLRE